MLKNFETHSMFRSFLICGLLVILILAVYWQVGTHDFLNFDDDQYITANPYIANGLTRESVSWAFTSVQNFNWHPLTWLSHALDIDLFGMNPRGHHLMNVAIHSAGTIILFAALFSLTAGLWQSAFVAALFALHPLHVESVAWAAERKDVLSGMFWFLTLLFYSRYADLRRCGKPALISYLAALLAFFLGLMSKPMLVTLPIILFLIDYWPLQRVGPNLQNQPAVSVRIMEKIPFIIGSLASCFITIHAQKIGGSMIQLNVIPMIVRLQNALVSYREYLSSIFYPHDLAVLYPFTMPIPLQQTIVSSLMLFAVSLICCVTYRRSPYLLTGWLWFLVTLVPVIGIIQVGNQAMADRYMYIPATGIFIMITWGATDIRNVFFPPSAGLSGKRLVFNTVFHAIPVAIILLCLVSSWRQTAYWKNNITLYNRALQVTTNNHIIHYNLGVTYRKAGKRAASLQEFEKALVINPRDADIRTMYAYTLAESGNIDAAIIEFRRTISLHPDYIVARNYLKYWIERQKVLTNLK